MSMSGLNLSDSGLNLTSLIVRTMFVILEYNKSLDRYLLLCSNKI